MPDRSNRAWLGSPKQLNIPFIKNTMDPKTVRSLLMQVEWRNIDDIKPYANNPRHNDHAVAAVAASIQAFGFRQPLVVDEQDTIVVGETRLKAARKLGLTVVPVHVAVGLTPAQCKAYRIADNKSAELADWNEDLLVQELADLQKLDFAPMRVNRSLGTPISSSQILAASSSSS